MAEIKDWRGTPITVGARVLARSATKWPTWRLGTVAKVNDLGSISIDTDKSDSSWMNKKVVAHWPGSITVLTKDMFDE